MALSEADGEKSSGRAAMLLSAGSTLTAEDARLTSNSACGSSPKPGVPAAVSSGGATGLPDLPRDGRARGVVSLGALVAAFAVDRLEGLDFGLRDICRIWR